MILFLFLKKANKIKSYKWENCEHQQLYRVKEFLWPKDNNLKSTLLK